MLKIFLLASLLLPTITVNATNHPDVISPTPDVVEEEVSEYMEVVNSDENKTFSYTLVYLENIDYKKEPTPKLHFEATDLELDDELREIYIQQLSENYEVYKLDTVDWSSKFLGVKGRYISTNSEELTANASTDEIYLNGGSVKIGKITPAANDLSIILYDTKDIPLYTYNFATDTFIDHGSNNEHVQFTNIEKDYVFTNGIYVSVDGQVMTLTDTEIYINGKLSKKIKSKNVRPREDGGFEGEWIGSDGNETPFLFRDEKLQTTDSVWFLIL